MTFSVSLTGRVQGVGCRYYCAQVARRMNVHGSASNMRDGSVEVILTVSERSEAESYAKALKENSFGFNFHGRIDSVSVSEHTGSTAGDYTF
ncbi:MAG: acylphosphatase [Spirochaetota bacterium]